MVSLIATRVLTLIAVFVAATYGRDLYAAPASGKIAVGFAAMSSASLVLWTAQDEKLLAKNGIDADLIFMPGAPTLVAAINTGSLAVGYTGGTATLGAAAAGADFKIIESSHGRILHDLVVKSNIKEPKHLRGKRIGVTSIGGTGWMAGILGLEQLGLNPDKEKIIFSGFGDMRVIAKALESGTIDAALVSGNFTNDLKRMGYHTLGELGRIPFIGSAVVVKQSLLQSQPEFSQSFVKGLIEAQAYVMSPGKKQSVLRVLSKRLNIADLSVAEDTLQYLIKSLDKKPYPSIEGLRNIQRLMQLRNPKIGQINLQDVIDDSIVRDFDKRGYIDQVYAEYGVP
ncbi:MAG TPA: ABC transporter substrate-binding protein [Terriglobales bacterium]|nr:ABC transporter substrate-binding protein [Terriglobales bacterium]